MHKADIRIGTTDHLAVKRGIKIHRIEIDDVTRIIWVCVYAEFRAKK